MELKSTQTSTTAKLPMLKQENGNAFKQVAETTTNDVVTSATHIPGPVTTKEKAQKKKDVKARTTLLMTLHNKHLMTFNQYKDAKTLFAAIETRFEETPPKAMVAINGVGFDWSYMAEDEVPTNMALMAFLDSENASKEITNELKESHDAPLVKNKVLDNKDCSVKSLIVVEKKTAVLTDAKIEFVKAKQQEKLVRKPVKYAKMYRSQGPRGNQRNWKNLKSQQLGSNFVMYNKACFVYGSFEMCMLTAITIKWKGWPRLVNTARPRLVNTVRLRPVNTARLNSTVVNVVMEFNRGYVTLRGGANGGRITRKGTIHTGNLDFEDVYFVKELKLNLFSVSQMCDKKNNVLFIDTEYLVLSPNFKLPDENQILLRVPRRNNMYSVNMKNIVPKES
uniref:Ribonuclease H-like domain-containing protein n=1 Tax=Tanacetum cinerariifolium TaxID=118510 RepID=A0A6L2KH28_TANCI|nr:ribonuclease H-like domain-containing protein [Tanacetum cinerariifolium]